MPNINVDGLQFTFPDGWKVSKYDDWTFYKNKFCNMWQGIKSLDLLAISPIKTLWLIEVKDYRNHRRTKTIDLSDEISKKVFDTLAAILPAKINADNAEEQNMARALVKAKVLRVVLHLEQPAKHSKLFPRAIDPAQIELKMRSSLKPIDAHPIVVEKARMRTLEWTVE